MEIDSLTCQTELLCGQSGDIVRMFVNPRQDKPANLLPSGVGWRSHRLRSPLLSLLRRKLSNIVKVMLSIVKCITGIVKCSSFRRLFTFVKFNSLFVKSMLAIVKPLPGLPVSRSRFRALALHSRSPSTRASSAPLSQFRNLFRGQRPTSIRRIG